MWVSLLSFRSPTEAANPGGTEAIWPVKWLGCESRSTAPKPQVPNAPAPSAQGRSHSHSHCQLLAPGARVLRPHPFNLCPTITFRHSPPRRAWGLTAPHHFPHHMSASEGESQQQKENVQPEMLLLGETSQSERATCRAIPAAGHSGKSNTMETV